MNNDVLVVIGVGGMGVSVARRCGAGRAIVLADINAAGLEATAAALTEDGHYVVTQEVDVTSRESLAAVAETASKAGRVSKVVHTAGLSPQQASTEAVLAVDLLGVALSIDEFGKVIEPGGAGVVIASMAGHFLPPLSAEQERALAHTPAEELLTLDFVTKISEPNFAYPIAKQANQIRVRAASAQWGRRGARINSISPGIISTPMGQQELASPVGDGMRAMIAMSGTGRIGTPDDIAAAAAFLLGSDASFITGADLLVDGGVVAAAKAGAP